MNQSNRQCFHRRHPGFGGCWIAIIVACVIAGPTGCSEAPPEVLAASADKPAPSTAAAVDAAAEPSTTDRDIVLDLRKEAPQFQAAPEETRRIVAATFGEGAPEDLELTARASGHFTSPDQSQTAYILLRRAAMQPGGARFAKPMLAVFDQDDRIQTQFVVDHNRIAAVADIDGDGVDEILLAADAVQMGLFATSIQAVSLRDNDLKVLDTYHEAYLDSCEQSLSTRSVRATVFVRGPSGLEARHYHTDCEGDPATRATRFQRVPAK